ncbi:MAG: peptidylprolyl isomerase [Nitrosopumilus sp.]|nr:peptidylprolyl isomerase [Nitrosopumilus sp.]CAI9830663.1 putative peptidyl-prolyl cis-trans isomerase [Nitrosopumilaceae archaeon]MDA7941141.1 peptidylprolyl isomerase [Nitrosopumilus sp.]MDA7942461.1 peptidylprolyl isomerase [Nitrosopumilus sp.]MDA7945509.1 peptidylprolyl isomerase [Nitrosopumilus sp.]
MATARITTSHGEITFKLLPELAPETVRNFEKLARDGFYDGTLFHRVIPGFMIQGGDPNTKSGPKGTWGTGGPGYAIKAEFSTRSHQRGIVSMARSTDPDSAGSQFFIVVQDSAFLDRQYTVFGEVTSGMEVADRIVNLKRDGNDCPLEEARMLKVAVE